jgi:hypothetical protein
VADGTFLAIRGDDFGMAHAVNLGIVEAFVNGVLTQTTAMAPTGWIREAARLAQVHRIPVGMHGTLTSDWDSLGWRPLTPGRSLKSPAGTFYALDREVQAAVNPAEARTELLEQARFLTELGFQLTHVDYHMAVHMPSAYEQVCRGFNLPSVYDDVTPHLRLSSNTLLSTQDDKLDWLLDWLDRLAPGYHLLVTHPAVDSDELSAMTTPGHPAYPWTAPYRISDLAVLTNPVVGERIEQRGIRLVALADVPIEE